MSDDWPAPAGAPATIEVGASAADGELRYWRAKEAVRQGEARLNAQATIRAAMEARATAITGWAAASLIVATGVAFAGPNWASRGAAGLASALLFAAAGVCIYAARPRDWTMTGYDPAIILNDNLGTELEALESQAGGLGSGILANDRRLVAMGRLLRWAGWMLIAAPSTGAALYVVVGVLIRH